MVAGKVRMAMGLQKSPANPKQETPPVKPPSPSPSSGKGYSQKAVFSRSFGVYFPRSSAQVQPRPPDVTELLRLVEELRERESLLKTELVEQKLLKESVAIIPVLENQISAKNAELELSLKKIESLQLENERLKEMFEQNKRESEKKIKAMEEEIEELKKTVSERSRAEISIESDELSSSQRFQGLMEVSVKSNLIKNLKRVRSTDGVVSSSSDNHNHKLERQDSKREEAESERPRSSSHSRCNSEELTNYSFESTQSSIRSRIPRVPNPPPKPSSTASVSTDNKLSSEKQIPAPPPPPPPPKRVPAPPKSVPAPPKSAPPPPPPPPKGLRMGAAKVRRVPEVVEFYHSLMRRDSRRDSGSGAPEVLPATANARDMIGEIENRSTHLLAVSA